MFYRCNVVRRWTLCVAGSALLLAALLLAIPAFAHPPADAAPTSTVPPAPRLGTVTVLYDGSLDTGAPNTQGFSFITVPPQSATITEVFTNGITYLETSTSLTDTAGYFSINATTLDRMEGYTVRFAARVVSETHSSEHRAGFSVIALSSDKRGIEVGFWANEIWAQEGGSDPILFTHAEGALFDTTRALIVYELSIISETYTIAVSDTIVLSGTLRDYTALTGFPDPYETPNLVFLGDDTTRAGAHVELNYVSIIAHDVPAQLEMDPGERTLSEIGMIDDDNRTLILTLFAQHGTLAVRTDLPGGLTARQVTGNSSDLLTMIAHTRAINATLAASQGLIYRNTTGFSGIETVATTVARDGLQQRQTLHINVHGAAPRAVYLPTILR